MRAILLLGAAALLLAGPARAELSSGEANQLCNDRGMPIGSRYHDNCIQNLTATSKSDSGAVQAAPEPADDGRMAKGLAARDECLSYGVKPYTTEFENCLVKVATKNAQLDQQQQNTALVQAVQQAQQEAAARDEQQMRFLRAQAIANAFKSAAPVYQPIPLPQPAPYRAPVQCTSQRTGQFTYTNCN